MKRLSASLFVLFIIWSAHGQNLSYEIVRGDNQIGSLEVKHHVEDSIEKIHMHNNVSFRIIFSFKVDYELKETFVNGVLTYGDGYNTLNGASQKETTIKLKEDGYHLKIDGVEGYNEKKPITNSMSKIYHEELYDGKKVYSQYFGLYLEAEEEGEHKYSIVSPDGENIYRYKYGYCTEVKVIRDFATFYIRMTDETLEKVKELKGID
ncbi:MAG: DUF6134 family protein [Cyclobacteriaceae bacterium]